MKCRKAGSSLFAKVPLNGGGGAGGSSTQMEKG